MAGILDDGLSDDFFEKFLTESLEATSNSDQGVERLKRTSFSTGDLQSLHAGVLDERAGMWGKLPTLDELSPGPKQEISGGMAMYDGGNFHMSLEELETNLIPSLGQAGPSHLGMVGYSPGAFHPVPSIVQGRKGDPDKKEVGLAGLGKTGTSKDYGKGGSDVISHGRNTGEVGSAAKSASSSTFGWERPLKGNGTMTSRKVSSGSLAAVPPIRRVQSTGDLTSSMRMDGKIRIGKLTIEERRQRIQRYREKRNSRKFEKKVQYNCRKTLADSRPRVRGRFAKNDDTDAKMPEREKVEAAARQKAEVALHRSSKKSQKPYSQGNDVDPMANLPAGTMVS